MFALAMQSPVLSNFLLVVAGILVGYALSYPYRGEGEEIADELSSLRNENLNLQQTIRDQQSSIVELNSIASNEGLDHELADQFEELAKDHRKLQSDLAAAQERLTESTRTAAELRGEVEELQLVKQQNLESNSGDLRRLELTIESLTKRLYEVEEEKNSTAIQLENERLQRRDLDDSIREKELMLVEQDGHMLDSAREELQKTQTALEQVTANLNRVTAERDEIAEQCQIRQEQIEEVARDRDNHLRAIETIERLRNTTDVSVSQYEEQVQELESRLAQTEVLLDQANSDLTHQQQVHIKSDQERDSLQAELDHHRQRSTQLESEVSRLQHDTDRIRSQREEVLASLRIEQDRSSQLASDLEQHRKILQNREMQLQQSVEQLRSLEPAAEDFEAMRSQLTATQEELEQLKSDHHDAIEAKKDIEKIVDEMREELQKNSDLIADSRTAREDRIEQLTRELENERRTVADLRPTIAELQNQLIQQEERISSSDQHEFEMTTVYTQLAEARTRVDQLSRDASDLREQLANRVEMVAHLQQERNDALERLAQQQMSHSTSSYADPQLEQTSDVDPMVTPRQHAAVMRNDDRRGMIYTRPPAERDDLKRISGVAEKLEQRLNDFGVYKYEQIMNWDENIVAEFSRLLAFKDRISSDDWVSQAQDLFDETYPQSQSQKRSA